MIAQTSSMLTDFALAVGASLAVLFIAMVLRGLWKRLCPRKLVWTFADGKKPRQHGNRVEFTLLLETPTNGPQDITLLELRCRGGKRAHVDEGNSDLDEEGDSIPPGTSSAHLCFRLPAKPGNKAKFLLRTAAGGKVRFSVPIRSTKGRPSQSPSPTT